MFGKATAHKSVGSCKHPFQFRDPSCPLSNVCSVCECASRLFLFLVNRRKKSKTYISTTNVALRQLFNLTSPLHLPSVAPVHTGHPPHESPTTHPPSSLCTQICTCTCSCIVVVPVLVVVAPVVAVVVPAHGCTNALPSFHVLSFNPHVSLSLGMSCARDHNETKRTQRVVRSTERRLQATKNTRTFTSEKLVSSRPHETCESRDRITKVRITTLILQLRFVQALKCRSCVKVRCLENLASQEDSKRVGPQQRPCERNSSMVCMCAHPWPLQN